MQHLDPERLAAFDHEAPTEGEQAHLAACDLCRQERAAFARLAALATLEAEAEPDPAITPLTSWDSLSGVLKREGLVATTGGADAAAPEAAQASGVRSVARRGGWRTFTRAAAAVLLLASGVAAGRLSVASPSPADAKGSQAANDELLRASTNTAETDAEFASVAQATTALELAQQEYQRASLWLADHDSTVNAQAVYRARLAALDQMMQASRAGLYEAPQDPALNQYYLAAYTAREATLRQLGASLSVDRVMERY